MAVFTAIGSAVATATGLAWLGAATAAGLQIAAGIAVSLFAKAMQGEPEAAKFGVQGKLQAGEDVPRSINFGWNCTAGSLAYHNTFGEGGTMSARVIVLGDMPIRELLYPIVDGVDCTLLRGEEHPHYGWPVAEYRKDGQDHLWIKFYDGHQTAADPFLVSTFAGSARPYGSDRVGWFNPYVIAYARAPERNDEGDKPLFQGLPSLKFVTDGVRLYNPAEDDTVGGSGPHRRDDPGTWGGNGDFSPVVQLYNVLRGIRVGGQWLYGMQNMHPARLPAANWIEGIRAAQVAVPGVAGPETTYRSGGEIQVGAQVATTVEALLTAANARLVEVGGTFKVYVGAPGEPVMSFTDDDIVSTEEQSFSPFFALADTVNGIDARFPNPGEGWNTKKAPPLLRPDLEPLAGNRRLIASVSLDLVPYQGQVQRLMQWSLNEALRARRHTFVLGPEARVLEPGDVVQWTSTRNGYVDKLFRVDGAVYKSNLDVIVDLTEVDPSDYDWDHGDYRPVTDGPLTLVGPTPMPMLGWQVFPATLSNADGTSVRPSIEIRYDGSIPSVTHVRVQVRVAGGGTVFDGEVPYAFPWKNILQGQFLPNTAYEVRGIFVGPPAGEWSEWLSVTTPDARLSGFDLYDGAVDVQHLASSIREMQRWMQSGVRELVADVQQSFMLINDQDIRKMQDVQQLKRDISVTRNEIEAGYKEEITVAIGEVEGVTTALSQKVETFEVALPGKASVATTNALGSRITSAENEITSQGSKILSINNQMPGKASVNAVSLLDTRINQTNGVVEAQGNILNTVSAQIGDISADGTFRAEVLAGPAGYSSRIGLEGRVGNVGAGGVYRAASLFIDVPASALQPTRVVVAADQFVVSANPNAINDPGNYSPFVVQAGKVYIDSARIRELHGDQIRANTIHGDRIRFGTLTGDNIQVKSIDAGQYLQNGSVINNTIGGGAVSTDKVAANAITDAQTFTGSGEQGILVNGWFTVTTGRVLMIGVCFLDWPVQDNNNFGKIDLPIKFNGNTLKTYKAFYDDNFAFGATVVHEATIAPGTYNFTFHADNESGAGRWKMLPGSTLTLLNLKR